MYPITKKDIKFNPRVALTPKVKQLIIKAIDFRLEHDRIPTQITCALCEVYDPEYNNTGCIDCPLGPAKLAIPEGEHILDSSTCHQYEDIMDWTDDDEVIDEDESDVTSFLNLLKRAVLERENPP